MKLRRVFQVLCIAGFLLAFPSYGKAQDCGISFSFGIPGISFDFGIPFGFYEEGYYQTYPYYYSQPYYYSSPYYYQEDPYYSGYRTYYDYPSYDPYYGSYYYYRPYSYHYRYYDDRPYNYRHHGYRHHRYYDRGGDYYYRDRDYSRSEYGRDYERRNHGDHQIRDRDRRSLRDNFSERGRDRTIEHRENRENKERLSQRPDRQRLDRHSVSPREPKYEQRRPESTPRSLLKESVTRQKSDYRSSPPTTSRQIKPNFSSLAQERFSRQRAMNHKYQPRQPRQESHQKRK